MYTNNIEQLINFIYFIIIGMILSIFFDIFRVLRKSFKTSDLVTNIHDTIWGITTGIILIFSIYLLNNGEIRLYLFLGIGLGIIIYMICISKFFIKFNIIIIKFFKKVFIIINKPFTIIVMQIKKFLFKPISFIFINFKHILKKTFIKIKKNVKINKKSVEEEGF